MREHRIGPGVHIQGFDSLEEILAYQAEREAWAIENSLPEQFAIGWDSYVFQVAEGLPIFGVLWTRQMYIDDTGRGGDETDEWFGRGNRYGQFFSEVVPDGEYGSAHVVSLWPITADEFARAQANGWHIWRELLDRIYAETSEAMKRKGEG